MELSEFRIGEEFIVNETRYRCTDIGTRVIVAIQINPVIVVKNYIHHELTYDEAEAEGWFNGPPYALAEFVFDEDDLPSCNPN